MLFFSIFLFHFKFSFAISIPNIYTSKFKYTHTEYTKKRRKLMFAWFAFKFVLLKRFCFEWENQNGCGRCKKKTTSFASVCLYTHTMCERYGWVSCVHRGHCQFSSSICFVAIVRAHTYARWPFACCSTTCSEQRASKRVKKRREEKCTRFSFPLFICVAFQWHSILNHFPFHLFVFNLNCYYLV